MARRKPYTEVAKTGQIRAQHVKGQGDKAYRGFQCLNPECTEFIFAPEPVGDGFQIVCPQCGFVHEDGGSSKFYDYQLQELNPKTKKISRTIEEGEFLVDHRDYLREALQFKYCIICNALKPLTLFDAHAARATGRQGECRLCKGIYNAIKNPSRIPDQHREAAQKRRLYVEISGETGRINTREIFRRFENKCFQCGKLLVDAAGQPVQGTFNIDHTLPAYYLWPVSTEIATLLCSEHNNEKKDRWPSEYYAQEKIRQLAVRTGLAYPLLAGPPQLNPGAIAFLRDAKNVDTILAKFAKYRSELLRLRNRVLTNTGLDIFKVSRHVAKVWIEEADGLLTRR